MFFWLGFALEPRFCFQIHWVLNTHFCGFLEGILMRILVFMYNNGGKRIGMNITRKSADRAAVGARRSGRTELNSFDMQRACPSRREGKGQTASQRSKHGPTWWSGSAGPELQQVLVRWENRPLPRPSSYPSGIYTVGESVGLGPKGSRRMVGKSITRASWVEVDTWTKEAHHPWKSSRKSKRNPVRHVY